MEFGNWGLGFCFGIWSLVFGILNFGVWDFVFVILRMGFVVCSLGIWNLGYHV